MEHEEVLARLDEFIDGTLPAENRRDVEFHLRGCVPCAQEAADTRRLLERARTLPPSILPERDLWPGVKAHLSPPASEHRPQRAASRWRTALAVAATLAVVLAGARMAGWMDQGGRPSPGDADLAATPPTLSPSTNSLLIALDLETRAAGQSLEAALAGGANLGSGEGAAINEGLNSLALAIAECRMALIEYPDDPKLMLRLTTYYRERLELLEKATKLVRA